MDEKEFEGRLKSLDQYQSACTGCGLCLEGCATFQLTGWEHESPRGRIHLAAQFLHGRIAPESSALSTFDRCLGCHACEPLCPQKVSYHKIRGLVQELRSQLNRSAQPLMERLLYHRWIKMAHRIGKHLWRRYGSSWLRIPKLQLRNGGSFSKNMERPGKKDAVLAFCCLQDLFQHEAIKQTLEFMERLGHSLKIDRHQPCCGAIFERLIHGGEETVVYSKERQKAEKLQKKSIASFLKWLPPDTSFLAKGCHSFISSYAPHAVDLYQTIEVILEKKKLALHFPEPKEIFYQPYCHSLGEKEDPVWRLLKNIKGLRVRTISNPQVCCGGYCGETLLHPQHAEAMAAQKKDALPPGATLIVTSPDCWGIFHAKEGLTLLYPIQVIAQAQVTPFASLQNRNGN